jgi:hypothetical protein
MTLPGAAVEDAVSLLMEGFANGTDLVRSLGNATKCYLPCKWPALVTDDGKEWWLK